jgi:FixJ family two-component response regulator
MTPSSETCPLVAVVDDDEPICRALQRLIRAAGLDAVTYSSGSEFLVSLKARRPDCIVLDVHMPQVTGLELQVLVSQMRPPVPVIMMTGRDTAETRQTVMDAGAVAYLCKPVDEGVLLAAVAEALSSGGE